MDVKREGLIMSKPPHPGTNGGRGRERERESEREFDQCNAGPRERGRDCAITDVAPI
jgi:hypothetical protein